MTVRSLDPRVSLGNLLTMLTVLLTVGASWASLNAAVVRQEQRLTDFEVRLGHIENDHDAVTALKIELQALTKKAP